MTQFCVLIHVKLKVEWNFFLQDLLNVQINLIAAKYSSFTYCLPPRNIYYVQLGFLLCIWTLK